MADYEDPFERRAAQRMQGGRSQGQQHGVFAKFGRDRDDAGCRGDQMGRGSAMHATNGVAEALRAWNEHLRSDRDLGVGAGIDNRADALVAGDERIAHSRKCRHLAVEQEALGAGADTAPERLDRYVGGFRLIEREPLQRHALRLFQNHCQRTEHTQRSRYAMCHFKMSLFNVK
jgi:hypothetical protein